MSEIKPPAEVTFIEPPSLHRDADEWLPVVEALKANSGQWALIYDSEWDDSAAQTLANRVRGRRSVWAGEEWEVTTRTVGQRAEARSQVYARHISKETDGEPRG